MTKRKLTWRKEPRDKGLARVIQGARYPELFYDGKRVAKTGFDRNDGFYWYAVDVVGFKYNSLWYDRKFDSLEEVRAVCWAIMKAVLEKQDQ